MSLLAHCNTKYAPEDQVMAVEAPEWTETWHPIAHSMVVTAMAIACRDNGLEVTRRDYSMNGNGSRMFGVWELAGGNGMTGALGIRNSTDKSMVLGITAGSRVFVCDNLALSGDYLQFRKHTSGLDHDEMVGIASTAVRHGVGKIEEFLGWHKALREIPAPLAHRKLLTYNLMEKGALPPSQFNQFIDMYKEEEKDNGETVFAVHGAATRTMRGAGHFQAEKRNRALNGVINEYLQAMGVNI